MKHAEGTCKENLQGIQSLCRDLPLGDSDLSVLLEHQRGNRECMYWRKLTAECCLQQLLDCLSPTWLAGTVTVTVPSDCGLLLQPIPCAAGIGDGSPAGWARSVSSASPPRHRATKASGSNITSTGLSVALSIALPSSANDLPPAGAGTPRDPPSGGFPVGPGGLARPWCSRIAASGGRGADKCGRRRCER